jgi:hypothetical protein
MKKYMNTNGIRPLKRLLAVSAGIGLIVGCLFATHAYADGTVLNTVKEKAVKSVAKERNPEETEPDDTLPIQG